MTSEPVEPRNVLVHPGMVRITHWINAAAILIMIGSGWRIYNNVPIFPAIEFPLWATLGGDPDLTYARNSDVGFSNALLWHLAGIWLFTVNGLVYLVYGILSGRLLSTRFASSSPMMTLRSTTACKSFSISASSRR
jgi:thiosulfate reductase cytochrome b subunit